LAPKILATNIVDLADPLALAQALIRCASVTPADAGAQAILARCLQDLGFTVHALPFGSTPNLFARRGSAAPHICFAGHTDVVPPGTAWRTAPFGGAVENGMLYGRGACDMKGAIAAFVAAVAGLDPRGAAPGSISLLITGDEEGPATDGTVRVLEWMAAHGHIPDACVVGEPSNPDALGEVIKIGRRGSLNATLTVHGTQGHVAYPHRADNPVHRLVAALAELAAAPLDQGTAWFQPSGLQVTSIDVGNPAGNVIPAQAQARLNIRFNDAHTGASLAAWLRGVVQRHAQVFDLDISVSGEAFLTEPGAFTALLVEAVKSVTGVQPRLDTGGGTSDARFIARYCPVAEFGLVGATMHKADESVAVADLRALAKVYGAMLRGAAGLVSAGLPSPGAARG
jgi:succinyl-diaminopimelate desuccinylase